MKFYYILILAILSISGYGQDMKDYTGNWQGKIKDKKAFNLDIIIKKQAIGNVQFIISNKQEIINRTFQFDTKGEIKVLLNDNLSFNGVLNNEHTEINGFIKSGMLLYHIKLKKEGESFIGRWNILMVDYLKSQSLYLSVENGAKDDYQAYPFFGDNRFTGTWCTNFNKDKDTISFSDFKTGLQFKGVLNVSEILLSINLGNKTITKVLFEKSEEDWRIGNFTATGNDKGGTLNFQLNEMESLISNDKFPNSHSVLISKNGTLIYEKYFEGYNSKIPHDMRSASKSISSAIVGLTIDRKLIKSTDQSIYEFLSSEYQKTSDSTKSKITIQSLLTMSSGLDAIDFGIKRKSVASEDNYQPTKDWTKTILEAPMIYKPNTHANYGSANPHLLGVVVNSVVKNPLELYIDQNLFQPLEISNYIIQTDIAGKPYFGGGMYLTPRDMLKFGELYLNKGKWRDKRILPKRWIKKSFKNYLNLENTSDKNGYGYLWWHKTYYVNGKAINSIEARGAGGQYIFIIPKLKIVTVITSGNYRNGKTQQPEKILENYILPILLEK